MDQWSEKALSINGGATRRYSINGVKRRYHFFQYHAWKLKVSSNLVQ